MKKFKTKIFHEKVIIKLLTRELAIDLMSDFVLKGSGVLKQGFKYRMLQATKLIPHSTKLVAYHTEEKRAIGFLCLEKNTNWLYSMKYIFVDPKYRKRGLATRLINFAMILAKEKRAKKVNLNVFPTETNAINLYRKMGFKKIGYTLMGQGVLAEFEPCRAIKHATADIGYLTKLNPIKKSQLFRPQTNSRKNLDTLFNICQRCVDQNWIDFFEINSNNLIYGSHQIWQPHFFRDILINDVTNCFAIIFSRPLYKNATAELYSTSKEVIPSILENLLKIMVNRGISFTQIMVFNPRDDVPLKWFKKIGMITFEFVCMGKTFE